MNTMKTTIKKAMRFLPALFLVVLAGNTAPTCGGSDDEQACIVATQCEGLPHADCVGEWACNTGECTFICETDPQPVYCMSTEDCGDNEYCTTEDDECLSPPGCDEEGVSCPAVCFGLCEEKVEPEWDCQVDSDCGAGQVCDIQDCIAPDCAANEPCPATCMPVGKCVIDTQPEMCTSTSQCGEGKHCSVEDGDCMSDPACEPGMDCLDVCFGQCVPNAVPPESECDVDSDCGAGEVCEVLECWSPPCYDGAPCMDMCMLIGKCVAKEPIECTDNSDCPSGMLCQEEVVCPDCVNADPPCMAPCMSTMVCKEQVTPTICDADSDCPTGQHCEYLAYPYDCDADGSDCIYEAAETAGVCVPNVTPSGCQSDSDCAPGTHCEFYEMCPNCYDEAGENCFGPCEVIGECVADSNPGECLTNSDCAPGLQCELYTVCYDMPCTDGQPCEGGCFEEGYCVPTDPDACETDSDCPDGEYCQLDEGPVWFDGDYDYMPATGVCVPFGCPEIACPPGQSMDPATCQCTVVDNPCVISGCSGQVCASEFVATTCEWVDWYACFNPEVTACGPFGPDGECMWKPTQELTACIQQFFAP